MITIYADPALGAYGYAEKHWFLPHVRLAAVMKGLDRAGISFQSARAAPATNEQLARFHTLEHIEETTRRCEANVGSLDRATPVVNQRSRTLLAAIADVDQEWVNAETLAKTLESLSATLDAFAPFLASEGMVDYAADTDAARLTQAGRAFLADGDAALGGPTYARAHVEAAARAVCGAVIDATERILSDDPLQRAFVPIAGFHHSFRDEARSYCLYNDPALAIATALSLIEGPIAYIDVDQHHGDGVYRGFADDPRVIIGDLHGVPAHVVPAGEARPTEHTGVGAAAGTKCTLALGPETDDAGFLAAFAQVEAFVRATKPAFIVFEAGVDALATDPMSEHLITPAVFGEITRRVRALADETAGGRLLVLGGGGYAIEGSVAGWTQVVTALQ